MPCGAGRDKGTGTDIFSDENGQPLNRRVEVKCV